jgi:anthranilate synthase component 1
MDVAASLDQVKSLAKSGFNLIPIWREIPSDTLTPVSAFMKLRHGQKTADFLLESADGGENVGRYSFLGVAPFASLCEENGELVFRNLQSGIEEKKELNWSHIEKYLYQWSAPKLNDLPPFSGGAVGYISFDAISLLEKLELPKKGLDTKLIDLKIYKSIVTFDRLTHRAYIITHIDITSDGVEEGYQKARMEIDRLFQCLVSTSYTPNFLIKSSATITAGSDDVIASKPLMGEDDFCYAVKKIKSHIKRGDIFQCVLSDRFKFPLTVDPLTIYRTLRMINPSPYLFFLTLSKGENLLGSSPEMLVRCHNNLIETCPIAGTRPRGQTIKQDETYEQALLASVKEKAEHLMLVDLSRNDIGRVAIPGSVHVKRFMQTERFSHVMHLVSLVTGKLKRSTSAWQALGSCFPAGTLSGAPKIRAMELISDYEKEKRGVYGGAIVAVDFTGNLNSCITIRSLYTKNGYGYAQAGAGIVADSRPAKEYEEILNKSKAIKTAIEIANSFHGGM